MMPPDVADRLRASFARIAADADGFAWRFYAELFAVDPALAGLFPPDLAGQHGKFISMLGSIVEAIDQPHRLTTTFAELGRRHAGYRVDEAHYDSVGIALLRALRDALGAHWDEDMEAAWATLYGEMSEAMIEGTR